MLRLINDVAFHYVFGKKIRQHNLVNLLNAILAKTEDVPIRDVTFEETQFEPEILGLKSCRLDLKASTNTGRQIIVEVQICNEGNIEGRSLYYLSKAFSDQLEAGESYSKLRKTIAINILDFPFKKQKKIHSIFRFLELDTYEELDQLLELHFLSLASLGQTTDLDLDCPLNRWLLFLSDKTNPKVKEEIIMMDKNIKEASKDLERIRADAHARRLYELREKARLDEINAQAYFREEGALQTALTIARNMLGKGMDEAEICEITGLSKEEVANLKYA